MVESERNTIKTGLMRQLHPIIAAPPYCGGGGLLLSVSGGMDSMVMLDVLVRMAHVHGNPLRVAHFHHGTGSFADLSGDIVRTYCERHRIPMETFEFKWDGSGNFEYEAATFRKRVLEKNRGAGEHIVLAHHLQDQVETLVQTLVRGAGMSTPMGMAPERGFRLRPLLAFDRALLAEHAQACKVPHALDPANYDLTLFRNRIRHTVSPVLRGYHRGFESRMNHWMEDFRELQEALAHEAAEVFANHYADGLLAREAFEGSKPYLWDFLLKLFWRHQGLPVPKGRENRQLKTWLKQEACAWFDHGGRRVYWDLDGLTTVAPPPEKPVEATFGEPFDWEPFQWRLTPTPLGRASGTFSGPGFLVVPSRIIPKPIKEHMRLSGLPHRIRQALPSLRLGKETLHICKIPALEARGLLELRQLQGPDWRGCSDKPTRSANPTGHG